MNYSPITQLTLGPYCHTCFPFFSIHSKFPSSSAITSADLSGGDPVIQTFKRHHYRNKKTRHKVGGKCLTNEADKRLVSRRDKQILKTSKKKTDNPIVKQVTDFNQIPYFEKDIPTANKHMKKIKFFSH